MKMNSSTEQSCAYPIEECCRVFLFAALLCFPGVAVAAGGQESPKGASAAGASGNTGTTSAPEAKTPTEPDNPLTPHPPGIYYVEEKGDTHALVQLSQAPAGGRSSSGGKGRRGVGDAVKWKAVIYGKNARLRLTGGRPIFYFYFLSPDASASDSETAFRPSSSPNAFLLVRVESKKNEREIPVNTVSATVEAKGTVAFDYAMVAAGIYAAGIYKVQFKTDLVTGEYAFLPGGALQSMADVPVFDFGIDSAK